MVKRIRFEDIYFKLNMLFESKAVKIAFFAFTLALCYGYQLFSLNMTIDEEIHADYIGWIPSWNSQGRWGMGLLSAVVMPSTVVPTVSVLIGVCLTLLAFFYILRDAFQLDNTAATLIAALSITVPTLPFVFTFSTVAYGIGIGFAVLAAAYFLTLAGGWRRLVFAAVLGGFSVGIYQTFAVVVLLVAILTIWKHIDQDGVRSSRGAVFRASIFVFGSVVAYVMVDILSRRLLNINLTYVGGFISFSSLSHALLQHFISSARRTFGMLALSSQRFGFSSPWLSVAVILATIILAISWRKQRLKIALLFSFIGLAWLLCILADLIAVGGAPMRSVIYIPLVVGMTLAASYSRPGKSFSVLLLSAVVILAMVGNSDITNHLFASNYYAGRLDSLMATEIVDQVERFSPNALLSNETLNLEVVGKRSWSQSSVMTKSETIGASFFEWDDGNRYRVAAYLRTWGLHVVGATEEQRVKVWNYAKTMPSWPNPGWVQIRDGVLVVKLSDYTPSQKETLSMDGIAP